MISHLDMLLLVNYNVSKTQYSFLCHSSNRYPCISVEKLKEIHFASEADSNTFLTWVRKNFNEVHFDSFFKKPLYYYDELSDTVRLTEKQA